MRKISKFWPAVCMAVYVVSLMGCARTESMGQSGQTADTVVSIAEIPEYSGEPYVVINENQPNFSQEDMTENSFERYSELDGLGRCGTAFANIGQDLMPTEERGSIGKVKPSGWQTVKYDSVDGQRKMQMRKI